jgi:ABC-2 type transport system permease protein
MLVLFGWVRAGRLGVAEAMTVTAPGILVGAGLFFSCLGGPISIVVAERDRRTLRRLLASPLEGRSYFVGVVLAHLVVAAGQVGLVYGITVAAGGGFRGSVPLGAAILVLSVLAYVGLGFLVAGKIARTAEDVNGAVAGVGVPLLVLGGTFFPSQELPPVLGNLALANPIFHMNEAFRAVAAGTRAAEVLGNVVLLTVLAAGAVALGTWSFRRMLDVERSG